MTDRTNPFPGLRAFEPHEEHLFFGRDTQINEVLERLRLMRFLCVVGFSGSGKSSLIRSGVVPALFSGRMAAVGSNWRISIVRPGSDPIGNLVEGLWEPVVYDSGLDDLFGEEEDDDDDPSPADPQSEDTNNHVMQRALMRSTLERSSLGLIDAVSRFELDARTCQLLVIDQFEELFRFRREAHGTKGHNESSAFVRLLLEAARQETVPIYVVLTMRSDFLESCTAIPGLTEAINNGQYMIPRMTRNQRREAISGPVSVSGAEIAPRLVTRLLNDVGDNPDQLPIMQHALMRTWSFWHDHRIDDEPIDLHHYEAIGTMREALSRHAEEAYHQVPDESLKRTVRGVFTTLTEKGRDGRGVRRPTSLAEIRAVTGESAENVLAGLKRFRAPESSFLFPPEGMAIDEETVLDISHEALMRVWGRLNRWVEAEAESAELFRNLAQAAERYQQGAGGLYHDPELTMALRWREETRPNAAWASRYAPGFERAMVFLERSTDERDRIVARQERQQRAQLKRTRVFAITSTVFTLVVLVMGAITFLEARQAVHDRRRAEKQRLQAQASQARAERARQLLDREKDAAIALRDDAQQSARAAEEARRLAEQRLAEVSEARARAEAQRLAALEARDETDRALSMARQAALEAELARDRAEREEGHARTAEREARESLARSRNLMILDFAHELAGLVPGLVARDPESAALTALESYELIRDHGHAATMTGDDQIVHSALEMVLDALERGPEWIYPVDDAARALAMHGEVLFIGTEHGELLRLVPGRRDPDRRLSAQLGSPVRALAAHPSRDLVAVGTRAGRLTLVPTGEDGSARFSIAYDQAVRAVAFAPDGGRLAVAAGEAVRLYDLTTGELVLAGRVENGRVADLAFSAGGEVLAAAGEVGVVLYDASGDVLERKAVVTEDPATAIAFSSVGYAMAAGFSDGEVRGWSDFRAGSTPRVKRGHLSAVTDLCFSPDNRLLCSASRDHTLRLWQLEDALVAPLVLEAHQSWVWAAAFSPDSAWLYSGSADERVRRWATSSALLAEELCARITRGWTREEWSALLDDTLSKEARETLADIVDLPVTCADER